MKSWDQNIVGVELVVPCVELDPTLSFFTETLGFRIESIYPADAPTLAVLSGHGVRLCLRSGRAEAPGTLRLHCRDDQLTGLPDTAPNGTRLEWVAVDPAIAMPKLQPSLVINRLSESNIWSEGRAGMRYRDLIPDRQGGRFIASHIHIESGGPVPDYLHYHEIWFQMIYCHRGWVRVAYQDQGPDFVVRAGDCILQPPRIRHQVIESSANLEVIELTSPGRHHTRADHEMTLPTRRAPERQYGGQRFTHHQAARATWHPWRLPGFEARDLLGDAARGLARAQVARAGAPSRVEAQTHDHALRFAFVIGGELTLSCRDQEPQHLSSGDSFVVPAGLAHSISTRSELELLEVTVPRDRTS